MNARAAPRQEASVWVGRAALEVGELALIRDGRREYSTFAYSRSWLARAERFEISPDLPLREGYFTRRSLITLGSRLTLYSLNRLNVATSRAQCACILVANPKLFEPECRTPRQMQLANALCRYLEVGRVLGIPE